MNGRTGRWIHCTMLLRPLPRTRPFGALATTCAAVPNMRLACAMAGGKDAGFSLLASSRRWDSGRRHTCHARYLGSPIGLYYLSYPFDSFSLMPSSPSMLAHSQITTPPAPPDVARLPRGLDDTSTAFSSHPLSSRPSLSHERFRAASGLRQGLLPADPTYAATDPLHSTASNMNRFVGVALCLIDTFNNKHCATSTCI
ncbi:hypothetical protein DE146DRAFT_367216 [Phaeosphaeria sp. MPI-PUGE-AT-0046c]|nr:hypothetical protein DE146DRAFT_367216 [Phaeosphaeria sp. MPI-PUGE-AT-0046c]